METQTQTNFSKDIKYLKQQPLKIGITLLIAGTITIAYTITSNTFPNTSPAFDPVKSAMNSALNLICFFSLTIGIILIIIQKRTRN